MNYKNKLQIQVIKIIYELTIKVFKYFFQVQAKHVSLVF